MNFQNLSQAEIDSLSNIKPMYLREHKNGSFVYRPPNLKSKSFGKDRVLAYVAAHKMNDQLGLKKEPEDLVESFLKANEGLLTINPEIKNSSQNKTQSAALIVKKSDREKPQLKPGCVTLSTALQSAFEFWVKEVNPGDNTLKNNTGFVANLRACDYADWPIDQLYTFEYAKILETANGDFYGRWRTWLCRAVEHALNKGWIISTMANQAEQTKSKRIKEKDRVRLSLKQFVNIYDLASNELKLALDIMQYTTLRPGDVANMRFTSKKENDNFFIENNVLHVVPQKSLTKKRSGDATYLKWDLTKHPVLNKLIKKAKLVAKENGNCPFVLSRMPKRLGAQNIGNKEHRAQMTVKNLSEEFREIRAQLIEDTKLFLGIKKNELPPLYEVRSLSSWLISKQGVEKSDLSTLMAHTDEKTTDDFYLNGHAPEWINVAIAVDYKESSQYKNALNELH